MTVRTRIFKAVLCGLLGVAGAGVALPAAAQESEARVKETKADLARAEKAAVSSTPVVRGKGDRDTAAEKNARADALAKTLRESSEYRAQTQAKDELVSLGVAALPAAVDLLSSDKQLVRIFAVLILRDAGQKAPMEEVVKKKWNPYAALFRLLGDEDPKIRLHASLALREMTGFDAQFSHTGPKTYRDLAIERWREYLVGNGLMLAQTSAGAQKGATAKKAKKGEAGKDSKKTAKKSKKETTKAAEKKEKGERPKEERKKENEADSKTSPAPDAAAPAPEAATASGGPFRDEVDASIREPEIVIVNRSDESITLRLEGPVEKKIHVLGKQTKRTAIPEGNYRYTASAKDVEGAEGEQTFQSRHRYTWTFMIEEVED